MLVQTNRALAIFGEDYITTARRELNLTRTVKSKTTGKSYKKKISNTGKLADSFKYNIKDGELLISAASYARDISEGNPANASWAMLINWIRSKPYKFKTTSFDTQGNITSRGTASGTPKQIDNFAKYLRKKIAKVGTDKTGYLDDILTSITKRHEDLIVESVTADIANGIVNNLNKKHLVTARHV